jgi:hypothetical protein
VSWKPIDVIQSTLRDTMKDRDRPGSQPPDLGDIRRRTGVIQTAASNAPIDFLAQALARTAKGNQVS